MQIASHIAVGNTLSLKQTNGWIQKPNVQFFIVYSRQVLFVSGAHFVIQEISD